MLVVWYFNRYFDVINVFPFHVCTVVCWFSAMQISYSCYNRKYEERCLNFGQTRCHLFTQMPSVLFGMSVISFAIKKRIVYVSWTFWIFPYISKFNRSMNVSKSNEIIVRRYTQWPLVRVCFIYGTINDRFPQLLWRETPFE